MELLPGSGQQPSVYPSDSRLSYAVCVKLRFVCHEYTSLFLRLFIRIHDSAKWNLAGFLCQVGIFKQFHRIIGKIR